MSITTWAATTGDWDDSKFSRAWDGPAISPAVGSLALSSSIPKSALEIYLSVGKANLELLESYEWDEMGSATWEDTTYSWATGPSPGVAISDPRNPSKADLTLTGSSAPELGIEYKFPVAVGELTTTATAPSVGEALHITPGVANLEIIQSYEWDQLTSSWINTVGDWSSGPVPQVAVGSGISPDKADLTFTAYSPSSGIKYNFRITAPTLTLTGQLASTSEGLVISPENASLEIIQTYNWDTYGGTWAASSDNWGDEFFVPTAIEKGQNEPDAGSLTLAGSAPDRTIQQLWYVPAGSLSLTGFVPTDITGHNFSPNAASISGLGTTSWGDTSGDWASSSDTWGEGTLTPIVGVTYTFVIDSSGNLVFTPYDPAWPLVGDPTYIAGIVIS